MDPVKVTYLGHSGFLIESARRLILFDYYTGDLGLVRRRAADKPLYVFASHVHHDHFNPEIFGLAETVQDVTFIFSFDIEEAHLVPDGYNVLVVDAGETYRIPGLGRVQTLSSTDEGVAFYIDTDEGFYYHAGDLHWWDWQHESIDYRADMAAQYQNEIDIIAGKPIDLAFVVLDPRLGDTFANGMDYFLSVCSPKYVFPMHFWDKRDIYDRYMLLRGVDADDGGADETAGAGGAESDSADHAHKPQILDTTRESFWKLP